MVATGVGMDAGLDWKRVQAGGVMVEWRAGHINSQQSGQQIRLPAHSVPSDPQYCHTTTPTRNELEQLLCFSDSSLSHLPAASAQWPCCCQLYEPVVPARTCGHPPSLAAFPMSPIDFTLNVPSSALHVQCLSILVTPQCVSTTPAIW